jgi:hypothetical protein
VRSALKGLDARSAQNGLPCFVTNRWRREPKIRCRRRAEVVSNDQQYRIARTIPNQTRVDRYYLVDECHWSLVQGASLVCTVIWKVQSPTPYILQLYHLVRNLGCSRTPHAKVLSLREGTTAMNMGKRCISTSNDRRR